MKSYHAGGPRHSRRCSHSAATTGPVRRRAAARAAIEPLDRRVLMSVAPSAALAAAAFSPVALGTPVNVTRSSAYEAEGTIAVDPTDPSRVFTASETDAGGILAAYSTDGGVTWTTRRIADGGDTLGRGDKNPQAAFDPFGNLYLTYLETTAQRAVRVAVSSDGGQTFAPLHAVVAPGLDQPSVAVGGDAAGAGASSVWLTYRNSSGGISATGARVTGRGIAQVGTFSSPQSVPGGAGNFGDIAVSPGGAVVVTWQTNTGGEGPAAIQVSTDADGLGTGGFSPPVTATTTNVGGFDFLPAQPLRAIDAEANLAFDHSAGGRRGRLYLVYTDESPDESNNFDVFVRASSDNGATWGAPTRVNDDATTRSQFLPEIAVDATTGRLAVGWYDARDDAGVVGSGSLDTVANNDVRYWGAVSGDGGVSFQNFPVAAGVSSAAAAGSLTDLGDYTAVAAHGGRAHFGWADNSMSLADNPLRPKMEWATASGAVSVVAGPCVISVTPEGAVFGAVNRVDVTFDRAMDPATFSAPSDVVSFTGPAGDVKAQLTDTEWLNGNRTLRLSFPSQETPGVYSLTLGADIRSVAGDRLDSNVNGVAGEATADQFLHAFTITPPRVTAHGPGSPKVGTTSSFDLEFNQPMNPASFSLADDLVSFTGPGGVDLRGAVTGSSWSNGNRTLRVNFDRQGGDGLYAMTVGPGVLAAAGGWAMDQDGDFTLGEAGSDAYTATLTIDRSTGPDAFGYEAATHAFQFLDLTPTGAGVSTALDGVDDGSAAIPLGANSFNFYGRAHTGPSALFVSSNGLITFGGGERLFQNTDLSDAPGRPTIAPLWDDWRTDIGTDSRVLYRFDDLNADGTPDRLVIEWNSVPNAGGSTTNPATFQAILQLNTNGTPGEILFNYPDLDVGAASLLNGAGATVGIRDAADQGQGRRLLVSMNFGTGPYVASGKAVRIATTVQPQQAPTVTSLSDNPDSVRTGGNVTLTANNVIDVDGGIASVAFYREGNGTAGLQTGPGGDVLLGTDASGAGGYSIVASTAGLPDATYTYYAVATDDDGATSNVVAATGKVDNVAPTVDIVDVTPDPRLEQLSSVAVRFSEAVTGVDLSDFTLTRDGGANLLTSGQSVTTSDGGVTWAVGGLWRIAFPAGNYVLTLKSSGHGIADVAGNALSGGATEAWRKDSLVVGRRTFYNQSNFDKVNPAADMSDDIAIAVDKSALRPSQRASFENVTSYNRGINGIMIDLFGMTGMPTVSDFEFRVGTGGDPSKWQPGPTPLSIVRRGSAGDGDSDRVAVTFPSGSIVNKWLQVTMKATPTTGLARPDVFYFGNLVGETGNVAPGATALSVNAGDLAAVRDAMYASNVHVTNRQDFNRDGKVNATDLGLVRANLARSLRLITAPSATSASAAGAASSQSTVTTATATRERTRTTVRSELLFSSDAIV